MRKRLVLLAVLLSLGLGVAVSCDALRRGIVRVYPTNYRVEGDPTNVTPLFQGFDEKRPRAAITLVSVATGFTKPTAVEFVPGEPETFVVLEQQGALKWFSLLDGATGTKVTLDVTSVSEQGLLGIAFHPGWGANRRFFLHYTTVKDGKDISRVEEWSAEAGKPFRDAKLTAKSVVLELEQPYQNHNGGHLLFGPDGMLYIGFGDGGFAGDPHGHGQRMDSLLGKMLRIDVDRQDPGKAYAVPKDNPFVSTAGAKGEIWALGLRNPWRYAFTPGGKLIVADVGQDKWEEVGIVDRGDNLGWNVREGKHCFEPKEGCRTEGLRDPAFEVEHPEGSSITGGVVATSERLPESLRGAYLFGDFISGRLWALPVDGDKLGDAIALGKWPVLPVSFGRDERGEVYFADFGRGAIFRIDPAPAAK